MHTVAQITRPIPRPIIEKSIPQKTTGEIFPQLTLIEIIKVITKGVIGAITEEITRYEVKIITGVEGGTQEVQTGQICNAGDATNMDTPNGNAINSREMNSPRQKISRPRV